MSFKKIPIQKDLKQMLKFVTDNSVFSEEAKQEEHLKLKTYLTNYINQEKNPDKLKTAHYILQLIEVRLNLTTYEPKTDNTRTS